MFSVKELEKPKIDYREPIIKNGDKQFAVIAQDQRGEGFPIYSESRRIDELSETEKQSIVLAAFDIYSRLSRMVGIRAPGDCYSPTCLEDN